MDSPSGSAVHPSPDSQKEAIDLTNLELPSLTVQSEETPQPAKHFDILHSPTVDDTKDRGPRRSLLLAQNTFFSSANPSETGIPVLKVYGCEPDARSIHFCHSQHGRTTSQFAVEHRQGGHVQPRDPLLPRYCCGATTATLLDPIETLSPANHLVCPVSPTPCD